MTKYEISVVSDTVCPWCYVGHRRLQNAIREHKSKYPEDVFNTTWRPYQLNPDAPIVGTDKRKMYEAKFGPGTADSIFGRLSQVGAQDGIKFSFGGKTGNTRTSHRLIEYARAKEARDGGEHEGLQTRLVEALFKAYFEDEKDITSHAVMTEAGVQAGLEEGEVKKVLESDEGGAIVDREVKEARMGGVTGVPHFTINDSYEVGGAQEPRAFETLFRRLKDQSKA